MKVKPSRDKPLLPRDVGVRRSGPSNALLEDEARLPGRHECPRTYLVSGLVPVVPEDSFPGEKFDMPKALEEAAVL